MENILMACEQNEWNKAGIVGYPFDLQSKEVEVLSFILPLSHDYPCIESWYIEKVVPGLRNGTRKIERVERNGKLVALGIAKHEEGEKKICTVRVLPEYFGRGMGVRVFESLMSWLGTDLPHATVSEDKLPAFDKLFTKMGYNLTSTESGLYREGKVEYKFNETISFPPRLS
ncbi:N-acetyltransferase [Onishia niordana]|uniref:N-acetyltransferase n=1 Tax=Onishia niordana TaxID=2508711 RepID=UPI0010A04FDE|nr:N-acetyltransferase [Halomonas niordiana]